MPAPVAAPIVNKPPTIVQDLLIADAASARRKSAVVLREIRPLERAEPPTAPEAPRPRPTESTDRDTALPSEPMLAPLHTAGRTEDMETLEKPLGVPPLLARRDAYPPLLSSRFHQWERN